MAFIQGRAEADFGKHVFAPNLFSALTYSHSVCDILL